KVAGAALVLAGAASFLLCPSVLLGLDLARWTREEGALALGFAAALPALVLVAHAGSVWIRSRSSWVLLDAAVALALAAALVGSPRRARRGVPRRRVARPRGRRGVAAGGRARRGRGAGRRFGGLGRRRPLEPRPRARRAVARAVAGGRPGRRRLRRRRRVARH